MENYEILKKFGKNIQKIRTNKKISIKELSQMTEIREQYLKKIEKGTAIRVLTKHLFKIASALQVKPKELIKDL
ncbi:helix-turn-helix transcriptional regulator [bacterium]|nr:helix-turn-helix transcriptional regulator [bacterium]